MFLLPQWPILGIYTSASFLYRDQAEAALIGDPDGTFLCRPAPRKETAKGGLHVHTVSVVEWVYMIIKFNAVSYVMWINDLYKACLP